MHNLFSKKYFFFFFLTLFLFHSSYSQELKRVRHFGKNKGHLKMYLHTPPGGDKSKSAPLVVVLHGCLQCATIVQKQSGWSKLADDNGFYVLYPQQRGLNNPERCFKWYRRKHINKNSGENYSIKAMVDFMKTNYAIDSSKVFITGLSAGAAMSVVMMADYPETFNAGAIFAGAPYKVATSAIPAAMAFVGLRRKTPEKWGKLVLKQNPSYTGNYPRMIIYQGNNDWIVNKQNGVELMKQWTNIHNISTSPYETISGYAGVKDIERNAYGNRQKKDAVIFYKINKLNHALLVDPGKCKYQGGRRGFFSKDKNYNSSLFTAYDFGLIPAPIISGKKIVGAMEQHITYSVPATENSTYEWTFPADCKVVKNDNTNSIILNWGTSGGCINVTETNASCKKQYQTLFVSLNEGK
ncbi:MAG: extracellular catalytic domain type 1 short-chain-length polyhydroxyalkanoate depolymerase [Bacteroidia bacterium]